MKYLNILFCIMMILFIGVQYNDPDGVVWVFIYAIPAIWAGLAAFRLRQVQNSQAYFMLGLSIAVTLILTAYFFPTTPSFWVQEVYWETETAREGMGMMIASFVLLFASATIWFSRNK